MRTVHGNDPGHSQQQPVPAVRSSRCGCLISNANFHLRAPSEFFAVCALAWFQVVSAAEFFSIRIRSNRAGASPQMTSSPVAGRS